VKWRATWIGCFIVLAAASARAGAVTVGNRCEHDMNGQISAGTQGTTETKFPRTMASRPGGNATLNGSFYDPNFLSFQREPLFQPIARQSTSSSISIAAECSQMHRFQREQLPWLDKLLETYDSLGTFDGPGLPNYTTHGNSNGLTLAGSECTGFAACFVELRASTKIIRFTGPMRMGLRTTITSMPTRCTR